VKKLKKLKFEISVNYEDGKEPFKNQQMINKIRTALRTQIALMDEDGQFGKYQGYSADIKVKLSNIDEGE